MSAELEMLRKLAKLQSDEIAHGRTFPGHRDVLLGYGDKEIGEVNLADVLLRLDLVERELDFVADWLERTSRVWAAADYQLSDSTKRQAAHARAALSTLPRIALTPRYEHRLVPVPDAEGIAHCTVCGCGEGTLPTQCPGSRVSAEHQDLIMNGLLDFVGERWVLLVPKRKT